MKQITYYTDRDLLILAAKFCNYEIHRGIIDDFLVRKVRDSLFVKWNPLTDAGDRARACDEHYITIAHSDMIDCVAASSVCERFQHTEDYENHQDRTTAANYAATRLMAMMQLRRRIGNEYAD